MLADSDPLPKREQLNHSAVCDGDWKLVTLNDRDRSGWELYNLSEDRSETDNVIAKQSDVADRLLAKWGTWAREANVLPYPEQRGKPSHNRVDQ